MKRILATFLSAMLIFSCACAEGDGLSDKLGLTKDAKPASRLVLEYLFG